MGATEDRRLPGRSRGSDEDEDVIDVEEEDDDQDGDDEEDGPSGPSEKHVFPGWSRLCDGIDEELATHYRYARFTAKRLRFCEGGRYFSLDAAEDDPAAYPKPHEGDFRIQLYRLEQGHGGKGSYVPVDADPDNPSVQVIVSFRGQIPAERRTPEKRLPDSLGEAHLKAYNERVGDISKLNELLIRGHERAEAYQERGWEEAAKQRRKKRKLRKKLRRLEEETQGGIFGRLINVFEEQLKAHGIKGLLEGAKDAKDAAKGAKDVIDAFTSGS